MCSLGSATHTVDERAIFQSEKFLTCAHELLAFSTALGTLDTAGRMGLLPAQPRLGRRVKALRRTAEMTLQQLSERSGVSVATLSKIENGRSGASFDTVLKVARGLGVLFDNLVGDEISDRRNLSRLVVTRAGNAEEYPSEIYTYRAYGTEMLHRRLMPLMIEVKTRSVPDPVDWSTHEGEEFVLVLDGEIELHTEHYKPQRLRTGDAAYFDSLMRHAFVAVGCSAAKILSVSLADTGPHGPADDSTDTVDSPLRARQTEPV